MGRKTLLRRIFAILKYLFSLTKQVRSGIWRVLLKGTRWACWGLRDQATIRDDADSWDGGTPPKAPEKLKGGRGSGSVEKGQHLNQDGIELPMIKISAEKREATTIALDTSIACSYYLAGSPYMNADRNVSRASLGARRDAARNTHIMGVVARRTRLLVQGSLSSVGEATMPLNQQISAPSLMSPPMEMEDRRSFHSGPISINVIGPTEDITPTANEAGPHLELAHKRSGSLHLSQHLHETDPLRWPEEGRLSPSTMQRQSSLASTANLAGAVSIPDPDRGTPAGWARMPPSYRQSATSVQNPAGNPSSLLTESINEDFIQLAHDRICPIVPEFFQRYERSFLSKKQETSFTIRAFTLDYREQEHDPPGWISILHPEGVVYFYNEEKRTVTEADLHDQRFYRQTMENIEILEDHIKAKGIQLPSNHTLAMDLNLSVKGDILTDYYYVDHDQKVVFFLDSIEARVHLPVWCEVQGVKSLKHIRHEMEAQYWMHGILYPSTISVSEDKVKDLRDIVLHYIGELRDSIYSTSPYNLDELNVMLGQVNGLRKNVGPYLGAANLLCRMNLRFSRQRFYDWHGVPEVRTSRDQSVHENGSRSRTWLIKMLSPLLFSAPDVHLRTFGKMWVDGLLYREVWLDNIKKLNTEWSEFTLYATVLLNANVTFLAIQSVDIGQPERNPSPVQVACYLSIVASLGSILLGLLLLRQNRTRSHQTLDEVLRFLHLRSHPMLGLEALAILYSLPYTLLLWGMVSFLVGFAWNCFYATNTKSRVIMVAAWAIFVGLTGWCMWMGWVRYEDNVRGVVGDGGAANSGGAVNADSGLQPKGYNLERGSRSRISSRAHLYPPA